MDEANPWGCISRIRAKSGFRDGLMLKLRDDWAKLPGCVAYIVAEDLADVDLIWVSEFWESREGREELLKDFRLMDAMGAARAFTAGEEFRAEFRPVLAPVRG